MKHSGNSIKSAPLFLASIIYRIAISVFCSLLYGSDTLCCTIATLKFFILSLSPLPAMITGRKHYTQASAGYVIAIFRNTFFHNNSDIRRLLYLPTTLYCPYTTELSFLFHRQSLSAAATRARCVSL